jgi:TATA-binding protein-associated factor
LPPSDLREPHRCLIFAQHRAVLDVVESCVLRKYFPNVPFAKLDGSMPPALRARIARAFNDASEVQVDKKSHVNATQREDEVIEDTTNDTRPRILLMTTHACGLGLNLTAADTVIL